VDDESKRELQHASQYGETPEELEMSERNAMGGTWYWDARFLCYKY